MSEKDQNAKNQISRSQAEPENEEQQFLLASQNKGKSLSPPPLEFNSSGTNFESNEVFKDSNSTDKTSPIQGKFNDSQKSEDASSNERMLNKNSSPGSGPNSLPSGRNDILNSMGDAFQSNFSDVNIHENSSQAENLGAEAFTQGSDVHFAPGRFQPDTSEGKELLGHELTHVLQQKEGRVTGNKNIQGFNVNDNAGLEKEADVMGARAARGQSIKSFNVSDNGGASSSTAQMKEGDKGFMHWFQSLVQTGEVVTQDQNDSVTEQNDDKYYGTDQSIKNEDGTHQTSTNSGHEKSEKDFWSWSGFTSIISDYIYQNDSANGGTKKTGTTETSSLNKDGSYTKTDVSEDSSTSVDKGKTSEAVKQAILDTAEGMTSRSNKLGTELTQLNDAIAAAHTKKEGLAEGSEEYKKHNAHLKRLVAKRDATKSLRTELRSQAKKLGTMATQVTPDNAGKMAKDAKVAVAAVNKTIGEKTTKVKKFDLKNLSHSSSVTTDKMNEDGSKTSTLDSKSSKINVGGGGLTYTAGEKKGVHRNRFCRSQCRKVNGNKENKRTGSKKQRRVWLCARLRND